MTANNNAMSRESPTPSNVVDLRRLHGAAAVRILFGLIWTADAAFKFLPGFIHGQTLGDELGGADKVQVPVLHQWMSLSHDIGTAHPAVFAPLIGVLESAIAFGLLFGFLSNVALLGSAVLSFGIWSGAEGFHLPWSKPGITDLGPSSGYVIASLALFFAAAGATWSIDSKIRLRFGQWAWLTSPTPKSIAPTANS